MDDIVVKVVEAKSDMVFEEELNKLLVLYEKDYNIDIQYRPCHKVQGELIQTWQTYYSALFIARRKDNG